MNVSKCTRYEALRVKVKHLGNDETRFSTTVVSSVQESLDVSKKIIF